MPGGERCAHGTRQENGVPDPGRLVLSRSQPTRPTRSLARRERWPPFRHPPSRREVYRFRTWRCV